MIIQLTWIDSCAQSEWSDDPSFKVAEVCSVGFLLDDNDKHITIAQSRDQEGKSAERLTVPKVCVVRRVTLGEQVT